MSLRKWWQNLELRVEGDLGKGLLLPAPQSPHLHKTLPPQTFWDSPRHLGEGFFSSLEPTDLSPFFLLLPPSVRSLLKGHCVSGPCWPPGHELPFRG